MLFSAFMDNVPYTILMIPVCNSLAESLGISPWPLCFGTLVGTGIGGNIMKINLPFSVAAVLPVHLPIQWLWL